MDLGETELMPEVKVGPWDKPVERSCVPGLSELTPEVVVSARDPVVDGVGNGGHGREPEKSML